MENPFNLQHKKVLVTGASSGIGRQVAISLSHLGAQLILSGRDLEKLQLTATHLKGAGHTIFAGNINNSADMENLVQQVPTIEGFVHAAGVLKVAPARILTEDDILQMTQTNYIAPFNLVIKLLNKKKLQKGSSVVLISSVNGVSTNVKGFSAYAASKAALNSMAKTLALEYAAKGIRFNTITPGMIKTEMYQEMTKTISQESLKADKEKYPLGDYGEPEDVANACIYLLSDASKWVTGTSLVVDGGLTIN